MKTASHIVKGSCEKFEGVISEEIVSQIRSARNADDKGSTDGPPYKEPVRSHFFYERFTNSLWF